MANKLNQKPEAQNLWLVARKSGVSRRDFLRLMAVGGSAAVLAACTTGQSQEGAQTATKEASRFHKPTDPFIVAGTNLETRLENLDGWITPGDLFFVRSHASNPVVDAKTYTLKVEGDGVSKPVEFTLEQLKAMPSRTVVSVVECAGNMRSMFEKMLGQKAEGGQWITGGISNASWTGVSVSTVLQAAGVTGDAKWVTPKGLDSDAPEGGLQKVISMEKAMDPDTLLAYAMNGADIPIDNGYPVRLLTPGWVGVANIKWVGSLNVTKDEPHLKNNTTSYVLVGPEWPPEKYAPAQGAPVTENVIRSALALPWDANLKAGQQIIRGFAWSPFAPIQKVEWSADDGSTWQEAQIVSPNMRYAWARYEFAWDAPSGDHNLMVRATDEQGNSQPDTQPYNAQGYIFNMVIKHPVHVA